MGSGIGIKDKRTKEKGDIFPPKIFLIFKEEERK